MSLFIVATPIGNLGDMTYRAVETLKGVDFVIAEDTRHAKILFQKYDITTPLLSFHTQSSDRKAEELIKKIQKGASAAYISDAGTPGISDPGFLLTKLAYDLGIKVIPIPGACALTSFISACGLKSDEFVFHGFIPHKKGRQTLILSMKESPFSHVFYESVHRFEKLLEQLQEFLGPDRLIGVGRELTKIHEEFFRGTVAEARTHFNPSNIKGEFVVMICPES